MMTVAEYEKPLARIEQLCEAVSIALLDPDVTLEQLESASTDLRVAALEFTAFMDAHQGLVEKGDALRARMKHIVTTIHMQREHLLRRAAVVDRNLNMLLPQRSAQQATYSAPIGGRAAGSFGA